MSFIIILCLLLCMLLSVLLLLLLLLCKKLNILDIQVNWVINVSFRQTVHPPLKESFWTVGWGGGVWKGKKVAKKRRRCGLIGEEI